MQARCGSCYQCGRPILNFLEVSKKIARAKEDIYEAAPDQAIRIYNLDNQYTAMMRARAPGTCKVLSYSSYAKDVDVSLKEKLFTLDYLDVSGVIGRDPGQARIPSFGRQQVANAMAAACVGIACGIDAPLIWKGLAQCKSGWGRGQVVDLSSGAKVLFDGCSNSNPDSCVIAFDNFSKLAAGAKKYIAFGDMRELGEASELFDEEMGRSMAKIDPEGIFLMGEYAAIVEKALRGAGFKKKIVSVSHSR